MALTLDPATKQFLILQSDLTFVSGTIYDLDTDQFRKDAMDLLASEPYIWMQDCYDHNSEYTVLGVTYARKVEWINGFSIKFENTGSAYTVRMQGSNNNLFDVDNGILAPTPLVTVVGQNSAGLITIQGGGLSVAQQTQLLEIYRRLALDKDNPLTNKSDGGIEATGIDIVATPSGDDIIQTRQP